MNIMYRIAYCSLGVKAGVKPADLAGRGGGHIEACHGYHEWRLSKSTLLSKLTLHDKMHFESQVLPHVRRQIVAIVSRAAPPRSLQYRSSSSSSWRRTRAWPRRGPGR